MPASVNDQKWGAAFILVSACTRGSVYSAGEIGRARQSRCRRKELTPCDEVASRVGVAHFDVSGREPDGVVDGPRPHLLHLDQSGVDGQSGRVGAGPAQGALGQQGVAEVEGRAVGARPRGFCWVVWVEVFWRS